MSFCNVRVEGDSELVLLWHMNGAAYGGVDLNEWRRVLIDLTTDMEAKLVFEATVGEKDLGNIAIDDVSFTPDCL